MNKYDKKPFPWRCSNCRERAVYGTTVDYLRQMEHDGRKPLGERLRQLGRECGAMLF